MWPHGNNISDAFFFNFALEIWNGSLYGWQNAVLYISRVREKRGYEAVGMRINEYFIVVFYSDRA